MSGSASGGSKKIGPYEVSSVLGRGTYATVKLAVDTRTGEECAIKIISKSGQLTKKQLKHIRTEIVVLRLVAHPNIVRLKEILASKNKIYIVMEYLDGGDILGALRTSDFSLEQVRRYFIQICSALSYCQRLGISHRDIKAENLLLRKDKKSVVITDFGLSALCEETETEATDAKGNKVKLLETACGSPHYVGPEVISKGTQGYLGEKADVWSVGVLLFLMLGRSLPFQASTLEGLFEKIRSGLFAFPEDRVRKGYFTKESMTLIKQMLNIDADKRPTFDEILKSDFVQADAEYLKEYQKECERVCGKGDELRSQAEKIMKDGEGEKDGKEGKDGSDVE